MLLVFQTMAEFKHSFRCPICKDVYRSKTKWSNSCARFTYMTDKEKTRKIHLRNEDAVRFVERLFNHKVSRAEKGICRTCATKISNFNSLYFEILEKFKGRFGSFYW